MPYLTQWNVLLVSYWALPGPRSRSGSIRIQIFKDAGGKLRYDAATAIPFKRRDSIPYSSRRRRASIRKSFCFQVFSLFLLLRELYRCASTYMAFNPRLCARDYLCFYFNTHASNKNLTNVTKYNYRARSSICTVGEKISDTKFDSCVEWTWIPYRKYIFQTHLTVIDQKW